MSSKTLNPMGSDALALANVIAPRMTLTLTSIAEWIGIVVAILSVGALAAVVWAVQLDYDVVAVTPGGTLIPLARLTPDNEQAVRAALTGGAPQANAPAQPGRPPAASPTQAPASKAAASPSAQRASKE